MQRTIAEARLALDGMAGLSHAQHKALQGEIDVAEKAAHDSAVRMAQGRVNDVAAVRDDALAGLCAVRDDYAALEAEARRGRISAREYEAQLRSIQARQRRAERHLADVDDAVSFVASVEEDPVAFTENIHSKFPLIRPNFSF